MSRQSTLTFVPDISPTGDQLDAPWRNGGLDALADYIAARILSKRERVFPAELQGRAIGDKIEVVTLKEEEL